MPLDIFFSSLPRFLSVLLDADQCLTLTLTHTLTLTLTLTPAPIGRWLTSLRATKPSVYVVQTV